MSNPPNRPCASFRCRMLGWVGVICIFFMGGGLAKAAGDEGAIRLQNNRINLALAGNGALERIAYDDGSRQYPCKDDLFFIETDQGTFSNGTHSPSSTTAGEGNETFEFSNAGLYDVTLEYRLLPDRDYFERKLIIRPKTKITLLKITFGSTKFDPAPESIVNYDTFFNAPTVAFVRWGNGGIYTGIENPFFVTKMERSAIGLSFEPSLYLNPGETYDSEPQFIGLYKKRGISITDHYPVTQAGRTPRFANPCGQIALDRGEIRAMQRFALDYLAPRQRPFQFILYDYWYPLPEFPRPGSPEEAVYFRMIDAFHALGGDQIIFNPLVSYERPGSAPGAIWELAPKGSAAGNILDYAAQRGIGCGFYMGVAKGPKGNASALPFVPEKPEWKKRDDLGTVADENCLACDPFADWWFDVQRDTIAKYHLSLWTWDPGPGNGLFCYSDKHGHVPGKGAYKGWRNSLALLARLRREFPDLYLQSYYGRKEYGLWGLKYFDQCESYWEQTIPFYATIHPDLHADRINADGVRLQSWWNNNFRFLPTCLNHAIVHRIQEGVWDPRLTRAWDYLGWKYSVLSGLAVSGASITAAILPEKVEDVPGLREFYAKWLGWARKNIDYAQDNVSFGAQVQVGGVDGWARIKGNHGFVFLCNPNPRPTRIVFGLDDEIGLSASGPFNLRRLYPEEGEFLVDPSHPKGLFQTGDRVAAVVPAYDVMVLELSPASTSFAAPAAESASPQKTVTRYLDDWKLPDGAPFHFPEHPEMESLKIATTFFAANEIHQALDQAKPPNLASFESLIEQWKIKYPDNFAWTRPDRLWLVLPFTDAGILKGISAVLNGAPVAIQTHAIGRKIIFYADLTDSVNWHSANVLELDLQGLQPRQFLGPYLDYPPAAVPWADSKVVFDAPLDNEEVRRISVSPEGPLVVSAEIVPEQLHQGVESLVEAAISLPPDQIRAVRLSGLSVDQNMQFDAARQKWICKFVPEQRWKLILDVSKFEVWAVARDGQVSDRFPVPLQWRFDNPANK